MPSIIDADKELPFSFLSLIHKSQCCITFSLFIGLYGKFRKVVKSFVDGQVFQRGILFAILINTLSMGIEYHNQVSSFFYSQVFFHYLSESDGGISWLVLTYHDKRHGFVMKNHQLHIHTPFKIAHEQTSTPYACHNMVVYIQVFTDKELPTSVTLNNFNRHFLRTDFFHFSFWRNVFSWPTHPPESKCCSIWKSIRNNGSSLSVPIFFSPRNLLWFWNTVTSSSAQCSHLKCCSR